MMVAHQHSFPSIICEPHFSRRQILGMVVTQTYSTNAAVEIQTLLMKTFFPPIYILSTTSLMESCGTHSRHGIQTN